MTSGPQQTPVCLTDLVRSCSSTSSTFTFPNQNNPSGETREGTKMKPPSSSWNRPTTTSANLLPTMISTTALLTEPATPPLAPPPPPGKRGREGGELKRSAPASPPRARAPASPARITRRPPDDEPANPGLVYIAGPRSPAARPPSSVGDS